ncbi:MAG: SulP family inorganic anion transporter [Vampirovibrionales bacterium]
MKFGFHYLWHDYCHRSLQLKQNALAGLVVGLVAIPLAMAFAIASGLTPQQGLVTALLAGVIGGLLGGSRFQISGPTGAFIVILSGIVHEHGVDGLLAATCLAGLFLVLMGLCRLGTFIKYIPEPVIIGFTAGIGLLIILTQLAPFLGWEASPQGHYLYEKLSFLAQHPPHTHWPTVGVGVFSLALLLIMPRLPYARRIPAPVWALVITTAVHHSLLTAPWLPPLWQTSLQNVATLGSVFGDSLQTVGLESLAFHPIHLSLHNWLTLLEPAFAIAMLGAIESLLSATVGDSLARQQHPTANVPKTNPNYELIGQGLINIIAPCFGGFSATGAIARTATNVRYGATSPLASLVHAGCILVLLCVGGSFLGHIPLASLAAILLVVAVNMSDLPHLVQVLRVAPRGESLILIVTFLLTVFTDLVVAVNIGMMLTLLNFFKNMTQASEIRQVDASTLQAKLQAEAVIDVPSGLQVYSIEGPFFFAAIDRLTEALKHTEQEPPSCILIRFKHMPFIDISGLETLEEIVRTLQHQGTALICSEANPRVYQKLEEMGIFNQLGAGHYAKTFAEALALATQLTPPATHLIP